MSLIAGIIAYMTSQTGITDEMFQSSADHITPQKRKEGYGLPAITIQTVSHRHEQHMTAAAGIANATIQIDCWAASAIAARTVADEVRAELDGYTAAAGKMGAVDVRRVSLINESDNYNTAGDGSDAGTYRIIQDYSIWHLENVPSF